MGYCNSGPPVASADGSPRTMVRKLLWSWQVKEEIIHYNAVYTQLHIHRTYINIIQKRSTPIFLLTLWFLFYSTILIFHLKGWLYHTSLMTTYQWFTKEKTTTLFEVHSLKSSLFPKYAVLVSFIGPMFIGLLFFQKCPPFT